MIGTNLGSFRVIIPAQHFSGRPRVGCEQLGMASERTIPQFSVPSCDICVLTEVITASIIDWMKWVGKKVLGNFRTRRMPGVAQFKINSMYEIARFLRGS